MIIDDLIEEFKDDDFERIRKMFGDLKTFFMFLERRGRLEEAIEDLRTYNDVSDTTYENEFLLYLFETDKPKFFSMMDEAFEDLKIINGEAYLLLDDISELSKLFCKERYQDHSAIALSVLSGDFDYDRWSDTTQDVVGDVIEELTPKNMEILKNYLVRNFEGVEFEANTDLLERLSSEQNDDGMVRITLDNVDEIVHSSVSMASIIEQDDDYELNGNLESVHANAYNSAYYDEMYNQVWGELDDYFEDRGTEIQISGATRNGKPRTFYKLKLKSNWIKKVLDFIKDNQKYYGSNSSIGYYGSYITMISEDECATLSDRDFYPSWGPEWTKLINDSFADYF